MQAPFIVRTNICESYFVHEARAFQERREQMVAEKQIGVAVIAADFTVRDSFRFLLESHEYRAQTYQSDESFVAGPLSSLACIVVDRSDRRCYRRRLFRLRRFRRTSAAGV